MSATAPSQPDLFKTPNPASGSLRIIIELKGLGPIPSFKNRKVIRTWLDKAAKVEEFRNGTWWVRKDSIKVKSMLFLEPPLQAWMDQATRLIELQLRSALATTGATIRTAASPRSLIATLLPLDDCWTSFADVRVISQLCPAGEEGATIQIERL